MQKIPLSMIREKKEFKRKNEIKIFVLMLKRQKKF